MSMGSVTNTSFSLYSSVMWLTSRYPIPSAIQQRQLSKNHKHSCTEFTRTFFFKAALLTTFTEATNKAKMCTVMWDRSKWWTYKICSLRQLYRAFLLSFSSMFWVFFSYLANIVWVDSHSSHKSLFCQSRQFSARKTLPPPKKPKQVN